MHLLFLLFEIIINLLMECHRDIGLGTWPVIPYIPPFSFPVGLSYEFTIHLEKI